MKPEDIIETNILLANNYPQDDFLGFSPNQIHALLYDTFDETSSPIQFQDNINNLVLDQLPLFRIAEEYLKIIQRDRQIKLTPLGALPKKIMVELYEKGFLPDNHIETGLVKLWKEQDCISIMSARLTAGLARLVKKAYGKLSLTKKGTSLLLPQNRLQLFKTFFQSFTNNFLWSHNDGYPQGPIAQLGWGFSVFMLVKFGDKEDAPAFYAAKYLKAFPMFISFFKNSYSSAESQFISCYTTRTFYRFLLWFGFVTIEKKSKYLDFKTDKIKSTNLIEKIFKFEDA